MIAPKPKRPPGRKPLPGRRVLILLEDRHIARAKQLGEGQLNRGVRKALEPPTEPVAPFKSVAV